MRIFPSLLLPLVIAGRNLHRVPQVDIFASVEIDAHLLVDKKAGRTDEQDIAPARIQGSGRNGQGLITSDKQSTLFVSLYEGSNSRCKRHLVLTTARSRFTSIGPRLFETCLPWLPC
jgi:hypothetical protein